MAKYLLMLFGLTLLSCKGNSQINFEQIAVELDSIYVLDQLYRGGLDSLFEDHGWNSPEVLQAMQKQAKLDSLNLIRVQAIIDQVGEYPGKSLVGPSAGKVAFFVIQHAPDSIQAKYHDMIVDAGIRNELKRSHVAMYQDRYLMNREEPRIFGTQIRIVPHTDPSTGELEDSVFLWPIREIPLVLILSVCAMV
jgi:hypothetical protein